MSRPEWAQECERCRHLVVTNKGRWWKCAAVKDGFHKEWVATVRLKRLCRFEPKRKEGA